MATIAKLPNGKFKQTISKDEKDIGGIEIEKLYEFKFPRFATRYRYEDGEYSAFSPLLDALQG